MPGTTAPHMATAHSTDADDSTVQATVLQQTTDLAALCRDFEESLGWRPKGINFSHSLVEAIRERREQHTALAVQMRQEVVEVTDHLLDQLRGVKASQRDQVEALLKLREATVAETRRLLDDAQQKASDITSAARQDAERMIDEVEARRDALVTESVALESILADALAKVTGARTPRPSQKRVNPIKKGPAASNGGDPNVGAEQQNQGGPEATIDQLDSDSAAFMREGAPKREDETSASAADDQTDSIDTALRISGTHHAADQQSLNAASWQTCRIILGGLSTFSPALEFERGLRNVGGVRKVNAISLQEGTLVLRVQYLDREALVAGILEMPRLAVDLEDSNDEEVMFRFVRSGRTQIS